MDFSWDTVATELETDLEALNLGALATEHQITQGRGGQDAIVWVPAEGAPARLTYDELTRWSGRAANMLAAGGVRRGDRVLFLLPLVPELFAGVLGALRLGAAVGSLGSGQNLEYLQKVLARAKPSAFVTVSSLRNTVRALRRKVPQLKSVVLLDRAKAPKSAEEDGETDWAARFAEAPEEFSSDATGPADPALVLFSETGASGSALSHLAALPLFSTARSVLDMRAGETVVSVGMPGEPHFLTYSALAPLLAGATQLVLEDPVHFQQWSRLGLEYRPRVWFSSFKAIDVMVRVDPGLGTLLRGCRHIACTWPYDPHFVSMTAGSYGSPIHAVWTDPEFGAIQCAEVRGRPIRPGSVGRPVPGADVRVVDPSGRPSAAGRLAVRLGPSAPFAGYLDDAAAVEKRVRDGWFVTSRAAKIDPDGYVWIEG